MNEKEEKETRKQMFEIGLGKDIPLLDAESKDFQKQLEFAIWSTDSCSDYRNDRERPYNGQLHTHDGTRGKQEVKGLTMRDLKDCLIKAMLISSPSKKYLEADTFLKCWDFTTEPNTPTQFLLDNQNESDFISTKAELGTWRPQDVYKINWTDVDPLAITQNFTCEVEKMMGIYPNVPPLENSIKSKTEE